MVRVKPGPVTRTGEFATLTGTPCTATSRVPTAAFSGKAVTIPEGLRPRPPHPLCCPRPILGTDISQRSARSILIPGDAGRRTLIDLIQALSSTLSVRRSAWYRLD